MRYGVFYPRNNKKYAKQTQRSKEFHTSFKIGYSEEMKEVLGENKNLLRYNLMKEK
jgi:hypothetical protein